MPHRRPRAYADPGEYSDDDSESDSRSSRSDASQEEVVQTVEVKRRSHRSSKRSRSRSPPVHYRRREHRERSYSRSRSYQGRSRSTTPERYARHLRRVADGRGRGTDYGRGRGGHHHHHSSHHHQERHQERQEQHYGPHLPFRGGGAGGGARGGYQGYDSGARRGGVGFGYHARIAIEDGRDNPNPSKCLGVFGMPPHVCEQDLRNMFDPFGKVEQVHVVMNRDTGECRGYGFVYYTTVEEAKRARDAMRDAKIDGIGIRVDFSVSQGPRRSFRD